MTKTISHPDQLFSIPSQQGILDSTASHNGAAKTSYPSDFVNIERRSPSNTVFHIDDNIFTSSMPRASHWSIAWSDLMMTMFVLFLSMFAYQTAHQEFLVKKTPEIIGGDTTEALQSVDSSGASFPFVPIHPGLPLITGGTVKKVEQVKTESLDPDSVYPAEVSHKSKEKEIEKKLVSPPPLATSLESEDKSLKVDGDNSISPQSNAFPTLTPPDTIPQTNQLDLEKPKSIQTDQFQEIYTMSKGALESNNLDKFAAIDIIPDKTMRIILTGDLLFGIGESELSEKAKQSLQKVVSFVRHTPYMINIVGHTDNLPMRSNRFKSNWELSVSRASTVARFLINEMDMNPNQFVVSGYSSNRPIVPNTTAENRAKNRRVEIIISKRLPNPLPATTQNLK